MTGDRIRRFQKLSTYGQLEQMRTAIQDCHESIGSIVFGAFELFIIHIYRQAGQVGQLRETPEHGWAKVAGIEANVERGRLRHRPKELFQVAIAHPRRSVVKDQGECVDLWTECADELEGPLVGMHKV
jgi:hypothetical protein